MSEMHKACQSCNKRFVIELRNLEFYKRMQVSPPTWCPECRLIRRMAFRNERMLHKRRCCAPGHSEEILSIYRSNSPIQAYDYKIWWGDTWDPMNFGREYDFAMPFFTQWRSLQAAVPFVCLSNSRAENSDYCNVNDKSKDCYLISAAYENERVLYSNRVAYSKECVDVYIAEKCELCYETVNCDSCYKLLYSLNCKNCTDSAFLYDCQNCSDCFGCTNLRNKSYCIFNTKYTKDKYKERMKEYSLHSFKKMKEVENRFREQYLQAIHRFARLVSCHDVTGDNLTEVNTAHFCFDLKQAENCTACTWGGFALKDSCDAGPGVGDNAELLLEVFDVVKSSRVFFSSVVYDSHDIQYSFNCHNSSNLFGCIGLSNKHYCILNKQYDRESFDKLRTQVITQMNQIPYKDTLNREYRYGEFIPPELSPFGYNETIAQEYFPKSKEECAQSGYNWTEVGERTYSITRKSDTIPDGIDAVSDGILQEVIECEHGGACSDQCSTAFRIIPSELEFYRKIGVPLPRLCSNCRHYARLKKRNPLRLWKGMCNCKREEGIGYANTSLHTHDEQPCANEFITSYAPERKEIVYCEECYQKEVV